MADYIKREDAVKAMCKYRPHSCDFDGCGKECLEVKAILSIPAADVAEVRHGRWELDRDNLPICSHCGEIALQRVFVKVPHLIQDVRMVRSKFCPNCGAKMDGGADK